MFISPSCRAIETQRALDHRRVSDGIYVTAITLPRRPMQLTHRATRTKLVAAAASLVTVVAIVATTTSQGSATPAHRASAPKPASIAGLKVLLTNDDSARAADTQYGTDGKGLYE